MDLIIYNLSLKKQVKLLHLFENKNDSIRKLVLNNNLIKKIFENINKGLRYKDNTNTPNLKN